MGRDRDRQRGPAAEVRGSTWSGVNLPKIGPLLSPANRAAELALGSLTVPALTPGQIGAIDAARQQQLDLWIATLAGTAQDRALAQLLSAQSAPLIGAPPSTYRDVVALIANMTKAVGQLERDVRWSVNAAINQGSAQVADDAGMARMWVAERDACLHCLAYAGEIAQPGQPYQAGLTFYIGPDGNPKPMDWKPVWGPPRHPNCRCRQEPVVDATYPLQPWETAATTPSDALKREARRSVLKGKSGYDSQAARLRAVSALLATGAGLPKSVEARARAAVRAGRFS